MCTWLERLLLAVGLASVAAAVALVIWAVAQLARSRAAGRQWDPPASLIFLVPALVAIAGLCIGPLRTWAECSDCEDVSLGIDEAVAQVEPGQVDDADVATIDVIGSSENLKACPGMAVVVMAQPSGSDDRWQTSERIPTDDRGGWMTSLTLDLAALRSADRLDLLAVATLVNPPTDRLVDEPTAIEAAAESGVFSVTLPPRLSVQEPTDGDAVTASHGGVGAAVVAVSGSSRSVTLAPDLRVVVLVRPVDPFAAGWWTSPPVAVDADGAWRTEIYLGSPPAPAEPGHRFEVLALATPTDPGNFAAPLSDIGLLDARARSQAVDFRLGSIEGRPDVSIEPMTNAQVTTDPGEPGVALLAVSGASSNLGDDDSVVVLVHAVEPPAAGWWPADAVTVGSDGQWDAKVFVGSDLAPVSDGQVFELVAVVGNADPEALETPLSSPDELAPIARSDATRVAVSLPEPTSIVSIDAPRGPITAVVSCDDVAVDIAGIAEHMDVDKAQVAVLTRWSHQPAAPWLSSEVTELAADGSWQVTANVPLADGVRPPASLEVVAALVDGAPRPSSVTDIDRLGANALSEAVEVPISGFTGANTTRPIALEGEDAASDLGRATRLEASGGSTLSMGDGDEAAFGFVTCAPTVVSLTVRYSNDNYDDRPSERVEVRVDGTRVASFIADDTGGYGAGWNQFVTSPASSAAELAAGDHTVDVTVTGGDGLGLELDLVAEAPPTLRLGDEGPWVEVLQLRLSELGFDVNADGTFGPGTETAVRAAQTAFALDVDGVTGANTWMALIIER